LLADQRQRRAGGGQTHAHLPFSFAYSREQPLHLQARATPSRTGAICALLLRTEGICSAFIPQRPAKRHGTSVTRANEIEQNKERGNENSSIPACRSPVLVLVQCTQPLLGSSVPTCRARRAWSVSTGRSRGGTYVHSCAVLAPYYSCRSRKGLYIQHTAMRTLP
jgi:hypothetical protein